MKKARYKNSRELCTDSLLHLKKDCFTKRPADAKCAAGLLSIVSVLETEEKKPQTLKGKIQQYAKNYIENIKHTYDHKIIFALVEKKLYGSNSIDSITHDADKLILYILGFPKSFVTDFHRKHSSHHPESGKKMNKRSILCDNIASSPEFKPEKKLTLREHYKSCEKLQKVDGLKDLLEKFNYGESLDFNEIKKEKKSKYEGILGFISGAFRLASLNLL